MTLDDRERLEILGHAVRLECRSFAEYIGESAPPVDIDERPEVREALHAIVAEKRAMADELVEATEALDSHPQLTVAFDPKYTFYNYVTTSYALAVLGEHLERSAIAAEALAARAEGDPEIGDLLVEVAAAERRHLERVRGLLASAPAAA